MRPPWIATPKSEMNPTAAEILKSVPVTISENTPPISAKGTASSTSTASRNEPTVR